MSSLSKILSDTDSAISSHHVGESEDRDEIELKFGKFTMKDFIPNDFESVSEWPEEFLEHMFVRKSVDSSGDENLKKRSLKKTSDEGCIFPEPEWKSAIRATLEEHPLGLTRNRLRKLCDLKLNGVSLKNSCPYENLEELRAENPNFIEEVTFPELDSLYFLTRKYRSVDMKELLRRLQHRLRVILIQKKGIMPGNIFCRVLNEDFGIQFDPQDWGFYSSEQLVQFLLAVHPEGCIQGIPVARLDGDRAEVETMLVYYDGTCSKIVQCIEEEIERIRNIKMEEEKILEYEGHFVRFGEKLECVGDILEENDVHECYVGKVHSPLDFYVHVAEFWNELEFYFQKTLGKYYLPERKGGYLTKIPPEVQKHHLIPGMILAAYCDNEWFRCVIKSINEAAGTCKVFAVDYGFESQVSCETLRRLHTEVFSKMRAQAINCRFHVHPFQKKYLQELMGTNRECKYEVNAMFQGIVENKRVCTTFKNHVFSREHDDYIWEVDMSVVTPAVGRYMQIKEGTNVWDLLYKKLQEKYPIQDYVQSGQKIA